MVFSSQLSNKLNLPCRRSSLRCFPLTLSPLKREELSILFFKKLAMLNCTPVIFNILGYGRKQEARVLYNSKSTLSTSGYVEQPVFHRI